MKAITAERNVTSKIETVAGRVSFLGWCESEVARINRNPERRAALWRFGDLCAVGLEPADPWYRRNVGTDTSSPWRTLP